ncbi:MAG: PRC-barrel domain-containing protein [Candidatus Aenigmarchaeota archaeon]|nr:PRC-barrel domain-containing protein [Candidatus Aenigmarchaeota archaeon]MBU5688989.1 PRC-barrel domain-containing protein [Candidatus Aenigmarchaeota archaeon]
MPITVRDITDVLNKDVFTDKGYYCGKISDLEFDISRFKVRSIVIATVKGSFLGDMVGGKKGIIVPYPMVQSIGDVVIIKHITAPPPEEK